MGKNEKILKKYRKNILNYENLVTNSKKWTFCRNLLKILFFNFFIVIYEKNEKRFKQNTKKNLKTMKN